MIKVNSDRVSAERGEAHGATFLGDAIVCSATFTKDAASGSVTFYGDADFTGATFRGFTSFSDATFTERIACDGAQVGDRGVRHVLPPGWRIEPAEGTGGVLVADAPAPANNSPAVR
ncbi:pentapeptide repeat-containing protein [Actinomadura harenae]|uniref:Pentapeptide repeat-containing protein n=1 Tax=Actinomadura harenae TaxID=2483351 RepID=A0A3M2LNH4_9ACTN|nr:pentapeptide repeat-containing protein [Actinomadura harenae]RMI39011.1 hypothetical protein EBO15_31110 [Actinomadura harenae]